QAEALVREREQSLAVAPVQESAAPQVLAAALAQESAAPQVLAAALAQESAEPQVLAAPLAQESVAPLVRAPAQAALPVQEYGQVQVRAVPQARRHEQALGQGHWPGPVVAPLAAWAWSAKQRDVQPGWLPGDPQPQPARPPAFEPACFAPAIPQGMRLPRQPRAG